MVSSEKPLFTFSSAVYLQFLNLQKGNVIWMWLQKHFSNLVANRAINNRSVFLQKYFECTYVLISKKYVCCCKTTLKKNHGNIFNKTSMYLGIQKGTYHVNASHMITSNFHIYLIGNWKNDICVNTNFVNKQTAAM